MHQRVIDYLTGVEEGTTKVVRYRGRIPETSSSHAGKGGKIARFIDQAADESYEIHFDQTAIAWVTIDLNLMEVEKRIGLYAQHQIWKREIQWLGRLRGSGIAPDLLGYSANLIRMSYVGEPVRRYNLPDDWQEQAERMIQVLEEHGCRHNDIKCDNLTVRDGRLRLVDFGWATEAGAPIPSDWPAGIGRQHRLGIHRFDDRHAIHAALESAARDQVDRSIQMAQ